MNEPLGWRQRVMVFGITGAGGDCPKGKGDFGAGEAAYAAGDFSYGDAVAAKTGIDMIHGSGKLFITQSGRNLFFKEFWLNIRWFDQPMQHNRDFLDTRWFIFCNQCLPKQCGLP